MQNLTGAWHIPLWLVCKNVEEPPKKEPPKEDKSPVEEPPPPAEKPPVIEEPPPEDSTLKNSHKCTSQCARNSSN